MAKVGIMGGTFDPIHNGHLAIALQSLKEFSLDYVLFIPNHIPWMKSNRHITKDQDRIDMVLAAIRPYSNFQISYIEMESEGNSYTAETVTKLKEQHPDDDFYFIMGADSLFSIEKWYKPDIIFQTVKLLVSVRDDCDFEDINCKINDLQNRFGAIIYQMHLDKIDISSTYIRENIHNQNAISKMLPDSVLQIINERNIYVS